MGRSREAAEPGNGAARERAALSDGGRAADDRQPRAETRETLADEREREAGRREALLGQEQREAGEREKELDERGRRLGSAIQSLEQRTLATIERSRALLEASGRRLDRQESAVKRAAARRDRQQADVDRASAEAERGLPGWQPGPASPIERARELREQALTAIEAFAANEEEIARVHEDLAASSPSRRDEYRQVAERARQTARKARVILRGFAD